VYFTSTESVTNTGSEVIDYTVKEVEEFVHAYRMNMAIENGSLPLYHTNTITAGRASCIWLFTTKE